MSLFDELKRRKVFKVGAGYLVVAWLVVQAASIGFPAFDAPPWALRIFILVIFLGFPISLVFAWAFDVTPDGLKSEGGVRGSKGFLLIAGGLAALAFAWYFKGQPAYLDAATAPAATAAAPASAVKLPAPISRKSIAVLPFVNMSADKDQEYFSDGIAEEILNALAQVKDLKVAGRTSSFQFKGKNDDLRAVGQALGVAHILEGLVRKQGDKVRITAQLIQTDTGFHLWSESYDGDLKDVFQLQENIARAITDRLQVILSGEQTERLVAVPTQNTEAYSLYLQASQTFNRRDGAHFGEAISQLQQALRLDPKFARAHSRIAALQSLAGNYDPRVEASSTAAAGAAEDLLSTLSWAGRFDEVLALSRERWGDLKGLDTYFGAVESGPLPSIATAQRAKGQQQALAATLAHWRKRINFLREQGYPADAFLMTEARYRALAGERAAALKTLTRAIDTGDRDPLLGRDPAFADLRDDPDFKAQLARMKKLINAERAKLKMAPLP